MTSLRKFTFSFFAICWGMFPAVAMAATIPLADGETSVANIGDTVEVAYDETNGTTNVGITVTDPFRLFYSGITDVTGNPNNAVNFGISLTNNQSPDAAETLLGIPNEINRRCGTAGLDGQLCARINADGDGRTVAPSASSPIFQSLLAGTETFFLNFGDNSGANPTLATYIFTVAAVPVPAAGVLFGSALLVAGVFRRKSVRKTLGLPGQD